MCHFKLVTNTIKEAHAKIINDTICNHCKDNKYYLQVV